MHVKALRTLRKSGVHCFTSASFAYLDRARVLAETVRRHHPEWTLWLCLVDEPPPGFEFDLRTEAFEGVVHLSELRIPDWRSWAFGHDIVELCTAVKGPMLHRLLTQEGAEHVIYLDPDIALFARLDPALELLEAGHSVVLTPHQIKPDEHRQAILDNEIGSLKHGIYNLGFLAVRGCEEGKHPFFLHDASMLREARMPARALWKDPGFRAADGLVVSCACVCFAAAPC